MARTASRALKNRGMLHLFRIKCKSLPYPSSVSLIRSHISMFNAQFSLVMYGSVACSASNNMNFAFNTHLTGAIDLALNTAD